MYIKNIFINTIIIIIIFILMPCNASANEYYTSHIYYKFPNNTSISLKWDQIDTIYGYCIYITNKNTNKTKIITNLIDNQYTVEGLYPDTDYTIRIMSKSYDYAETQIGKINITTPYNWYYKIKGKQFGTWNTIKNITITRVSAKDNIEEIFDISSFIPIFKSKIEITSNNDYEIYLYQKEKYIYYEIKHFLDSNYAEYYLWRMDNSGENLKFIGNIEYHNCIFIYDKSYYIKNGTIRNIKGDEYSSKELSQFMDNYESLTDDNIKNLLNSSMISSLYFNITDDKGKNSFKESKKIFSGPVTNGKCLYFSSEPIYGISNEKDTTIYSSDFNGDKIKKVTVIPYKNNIIYSTPNYGSIELIGADDDFIYYYISVKSNKSTKSNNLFYFYKIPILGFDNIPELIRITKYSPNDCEYINGNIYFTYFRSTDDSDCLYFRININNSKMTSKNTPYVWH